MWKKKIDKKIDEINYKLTKSRIMEISYIMGNKKEIIKRNFIAGLSRGVGIGIGISLISAAILYILQKFILLNIPIIGDYISDLVSIVQKNL